MAEVLNSNGLRVFAYVVVALACLAWWRRERLLARRLEYRWLLPAFWGLSAAVLFAMAAGRGLDAGSLLTDLGREAAHQEQLYHDRRPLQSLLVAALGAGWAVTTVVAVWKVPERRRRYLPFALALFTVGCFAAVRLVSLHAVDSLLYRADLGGVRVATMAELALLVAGGIASLSGARSPRSAGERPHRRLTEPAAPAARPGPG